ncbi:uncharacterized protein LOC128221167 [Mya arenaria]|uniref:uncharacterized protein LOC128221167 n=1 Tax=Mya arenaria TaxID=6604 RepID=UPI0022E30EA9|nr:uncharacterized protein LOC128221167 [Mya arenaria]
MSGDARSYPPLFESWVKACIGLRYIKDGTERMVEKEVKFQYDTIVANVEVKIGTQYDCTECTIANLRPYHETAECILKQRKKYCLCDKEDNPDRRRCPQDSACSQIYDAIWAAYREGPFPGFPNSKVNQWSTNYWEFGKCFIQTQGYMNVTSAADTDAAGLLALCIHNKTLWDMLGESKSIQKVREARHDIFHSARLEVSKEKLDKYLDSMLELLKLPKLQHDDNAKHAIEKIEQLKSDTFKLFPEDVMTARKDSLKSISGEMSEIKHKIEEAKKDDNPLDETMEKDDIIDVDQLHRELATLTVVHKEHLSAVEGYIKELRTQVTGIEDRILMHEEDLKAIKSGSDIQLGYLKNIQETQVVQGKKLNAITDDMKKLFSVLTEYTKHPITKAIPIPEIRIVMLTKNISNNKEAALGEVLDEIAGDVEGKAKLKNSDWEPIIQTFNESLQKMIIDHGEDQRDIVEVKKECIAIYVQCWTLRSLIHLCEQCISGKLTEMFIPFEKEIKRRLPCYSALEIELAIFEKDLIRCMDVFGGRLKRTLISENADVQTPLVTLSNGFDAGARQTQDVKTIDDDLVLCGEDEIKSTLKENEKECDVTEVHNETINAYKDEEAIETASVSQGVCEKDELNTSKQEHICHTILLADSFETSEKEKIAANFRSSDFPDPDCLPQRKNRVSIQTSPMHLHGTKDREKAPHLELQSICLNKYHKHIRKATNDGMNGPHLSLIIGSMAKIPFSGLSEFAKADAHLHKMQLPVTGVKVHNTDQTYLITTDTLQLDANVTINALVHVLNEISKETNRLPEVLYIQMNNSRSVSKNVFIILFMAWLVRERIFRKVKIGFLMAGQTNVDIQKVFSSVSSHLRGQEIHTLTNLQDEIRKSQDPAPITAHLDRVFDYKKMMEGQRGLLKGISEPHHFIISEVVGRVTMRYRDWPYSPDQNIDLTDSIPGRFSKELVPCNPKFHSETGMQADAPTLPFVDKLPTQQKRYMHGVDPPGVVIKVLQS